MKKITLVALKRDQGSIMNLLTKLGICEITESENFECAEVKSDSTLTEEIDRKLGKLNFALSFLKESDKEITKERKKNDVFPKYSLNLSRENKLTDYDELLELTKNEYELFAKISELEKINSELTDIKADSVKQTALIAQMSDYAALDIKFSEIKDTATATLLVGLIPSSSEEGLAEALPENAILRTSHNDKTILVCVLAPKVDAHATAEALSAFGFSKCSFDFDGTANEIINSASAKIAANKKRRLELLKQVVEGMDEIPAFKLLYDYYTLEREKQDALSLGKSTKSTFVLDFWTPANQADFVKSEIQKIAPLAEPEISDPKPNEMPPTLLKEAKVVKPFADSITSTFGFPIYGKMDPNPFVAFFFFLFFGFMLSDAGYGVVMTLACLGYVLIKKPVKGSGSFITMLGLCGISTVFWGAIFGGWFAISEETLNASAFGRFLLTFKCIDPLDGQQTLIMFGLALGLGVLQIGVGFFLGGLDKYKNKDIAGAVSDWSWVIIFVGAAVFLLDMLLNTGVVKYIGIVILALGVVALLAGGGIGKKNPLKMVVGAFKNVYGVISVFSDVLSYSRLFGLGLCTGVIGMVFNKLGMLFVDTIGPIGYAPAALIWVVGHTFNIAINTLGVYVHNSRLQFVEFFGKFFEGGGRAFAPIGSKTKYTYLADKLTTDEIAENNNRINKLKLKLHLGK